MNKPKETRKMQIGKIGNQNARKPEHLKKSGARLIISCTLAQKKEIMAKAGGAVSPWAVKTLLEANLP